MQGKRSISLISQTDNFDGHSFQRILWGFDLSENSDVPSHCLIQLYDSSPPVVVFYELATNPGASITNAAERLINALPERFNLAVSDCVWIEAYGEFSYPGAGNEPTRYAQIFLQNGSANWKNLPESTLVSLIGHLPEPAIAAIHQLRADSRWDSTGIDATAFRLTTSMTTSLG